MKIAVNVRDQKENEQVQKALFAIGMQWAGGGQGIKNMPILKYGSESCFDVSERSLSYCNSIWFAGHGYRIISIDVFFADVLPNLEAERANHK